VILDAACRACILEKDAGKEQVVDARTVFRAGMALTLFLLFIPLISAEDVVIPTVEGGSPLLLPGILHRPEGRGPFPAVVMLVGCGGYAGGGPNAEHQAAWAKRLTDWDYVALQVDSYSPRGPSLNCDFSGSLTISRDAFAARSYLSTLPFVDRRKVAIAGWSIGGAAALKAIDRYFRDKGVSPFKAAVAFYPVCYPVYDPDTPLLLLTGRKDELCIATAAEGLKRKYREQNWKTELSFKIYPNAYHSFDMEGVSLVSFGHHYQYDPRAATDAIIRTKEFLEKHLGRGGRTPAR
jgi:dienelactone hydrolase